MKLRSAMWVALAGAVLMVTPAAANSIGSSTEPIAVNSVPQPHAVPSVGTKSDQVSAPDAVGSEMLTENQGSLDQLKVEGEDEAPAFVMPAALHMPLPERNQFKPEVTLKAVIDLSKQRMTVMSGDDVLHVWPISSGRGGYQTPNGTYYPQWRARMWRSKQYYNAPMPYSIFFHRGYAIHGTYATGMLGRPASHGCIRLSNKNAAAFYKLVDRHGMESTQIIVQGTTNVRAPKVAQSRKADKRRVVRQRPRTPRGYANYGYGGPPPWWTW